MKQYPENSAQALWRIMSIMVCADNEIDEAEGKELKWTSAFVEEVFGKDIPEDKKQEIIDKTIEEWDAIGDGQDILDYVIQAAKKITNRKKQKFALGAIINIANADGNFDESELAMVNIVSGEWGFSEDEMKVIIDEKHPSHKQTKEFLEGI